MAEDKKKQVEAELQEEQLDEVSGGLKEAPPPTNYLI